MSSADGGYTLYHYNPGAPTTLPPFEKTSHSLADLLVTAWQIHQNGGRNERVMKNGEMVLDAETLLAACELYTKRTDPSETFLTTAERVLAELRAGANK